MIAPHPGDLVDQRFQRMRILEHVDHGKVRGDVQHHQRRKRHPHEQQLRQRRGARDIHQRAIAPARAQNRHGGLDQAQRQRQHQRIMSGFRDHFAAPLSARRLLLVIVLPVALLLQRVGDVLGHIGLVVLGEHGVGLEHAGRVERAFGDHALPFAEQVRENSLIGHRQGRAAIGDLEADREIVAAHQRAVLHQAAEPEPLARRNMFFGRHRRRREEHDGIAQRVQHQRRRNRQHRERSADHRQPPLPARHALSFIGKPSLRGALATKQSSPRAPWIASLRSQ